MIGDILNIVVALSFTCSVLLRFPIFFDWRDLKARKHKFKFDPKLHLKSYTKDDVPFNNLPLRTRVKGYISNLDLIVNGS